MITLNNVTKYVSDDVNKTPVLSNIDLQITEGEILGVIGYSGAGKSTLLRVMNGLISPSQGSVCIDKQDLTSLHPPQLRKVRQKTGMVFQHFHLLWSRTVEENIALPMEIAQLPKEEIRLRVQELLQLVGLEEHKEAYPSQLSGGQKQRVGIARALSNSPSLLLCDEATSALDTETTTSIIHLLRSIHRELGITVVFISHEIEVVRALCTKVAVMDKGSIVECDAVADVFKKPAHEVTRQLIQGITMQEEGQAC